jgi:hypothetical protein
MGRRFFYAVLLTVFVHSVSAQAVKTEIKKEKGKYVLYRGGEPYFIKGAGIFGNMQRLKECGGNSIRLWTTDNAEEILEHAHIMGLSVTLGISLNAERFGFDYNNEELVKQQFEDVKRQVLKYKDYPALLMWGIGNEIELFAKNPKAFDAINEIAAWIKEVDPNHPVTTMIASVHEYPFKELIKRCTSLDLLAVNAFKDIQWTAHKLKLYGWYGPYIISEWGPDGYWETDLTKWKAFVEPNSTQKALQYKERYEKYILGEYKKCLGSYVFLWGDKQEGTHTYFTMISSLGQETEAIETMQYLWTGKWPIDKAPKIKEIKVNGQQDYNKLQFKKGSVNTAYVIAENNKNMLYYYWEIYRDKIKDETDIWDEERKTGLNGLIEDPKNKNIVFKAPVVPGIYRLFVTVYNDKNKIATANLPFVVK